MDLDDTSRCPLDQRCAGCGGQTRLMPATVDTPVGVLCLTMCPACVLHQVLPAFTWSGAALAVGAHCEHLGVDLDQAAELRRTQGQ